VTFPVIPLTSPKIKVTHPWILLTSPEILDTSPEILLTLPEIKVTHPQILLTLSESPLTSPERSDETVPEILLASPKFCIFLVTQDFPVCYTIYFP